MIGEGLMPDISSYNTAISAWGRSARPDAERRSQSLFQRAVEQGLSPDVITYSSLLSALSKSRDKNAPFRADEVFEQMLSSGAQADTVAWNIMITIWSRSKLKNREEKVQEIFERLVTPAAAVAVKYMCATLYLLMVIILFILLILTFMFTCITHYRMLSSGAEPNEMTYTAMLSMWGGSQSARASEGIIEVFRHMQSTGRQLDTVGYRCVYACICVCIRV
jgi:Pentatricopeptide repeat domain